MERNLKQICLAFALLPVGMLCSAQTDDSVKDIKNPTITFDNGTNVNVEISPSNINIGTQENNGGVVIMLVKEDRVEEIVETHSIEDNIIISTSGLENNSLELYIKSEDELEVIEVDNKTSEVME